jgi:isoquinoline 1-oxidoreductase beta subunit
VVWDNTGLDKISSETILQDFRRESQKKGDVLHEVGNSDSVFNNSNDVIESSYELPYQSHVPMEPMNVMASVKENSAEYWGSTQNPNGMRSYLSKKYNIPAKNIKINYTFMGGGFGRRSMTDQLEEAADLSKQTGAPIKVIWTREDDQTQGPFRNCSLNVCKAVLDNEGNISALEHKVIAQEIGRQNTNDTKAGRQLMGGITTGYAIPNVSIRGVLQKRHVPISYWRAVYHSTNPFAHESFMDELAIKAGKDPLDFRLSMLQNHPRFKRVLEETARLTNWYDIKKAGIGRGLAMVERSGAHFSMVVEVANVNNRVQPIRVTTIIDVGICINPDLVRAQTEGSVVMGLTAVYGGLTVSEGRIVEQNFNSYPLLKYSECPEIVTHILPGTAKPDGAGEAGLPTLAPALANAIFDLTGKRIRKLPVDLKVV